jgi:DNA-binding transcriptional LysR family regulator
VFEDPFVAMVPRGLALGQASFTLREVARHQTVLAMVSAGLGVALLPSACIPAEGARGYRVVPVRAARLVREICIVRLKGKALSPAAVRCADLITATLRRGRG